MKNTSFIEKHGMLLTVFIFIAMFVIGIIFLSNFSRKRAATHLEQKRTTVVFEND